MKKLLFVLVMGALALQANPGVIRLLETSIDPAAPALASAGAETVCSADSNGRLTYIVQPAANFSVQEKKAVEELGVKVVGLLPPNAYIVSAVPKALENLKESYKLLYCGEYKPEYKTRAAFRAALASAEGTEQEVIVTLTGKEEYAKVAEVLKALGAKDVALYCEKPALVSAKVSGAAVEALAKMSGVLRVEPKTKSELFNGVAQGEGMMNVTAVQELGYKGEGQIVAVFDSGLDSGNVSTIHPDFSGKNIVATAKTGKNWGDYNGHGTHVAGTVLGNGSIDSQYAGVAPKADLYVCNCAYAGSGVNVPGPEDFNAAMKAGACVMNNSWGSIDPTTYGMYVYDSALYDNYMWEHPECLLVFAAGNNNTKIDTIGNCTISVQATAKNVMTVAAAECHKEDLKAYTYYNTFESPNTAPYKNDYVTWPNNGQDQGMAAFSSRGPAHDGRKKPDICAPGTFIASCASIYDENAQKTPGVRDVYYRYMSGTSQATPGVSGCAALVREYLAEDGCEHPSGALVKAFLLNGARTMGKGQFSGYKEIPEESPNCVNGFGHVNLKQSIAPEGQKVFYVEGVLSNSGDTVTYNFKKEKVGPLAVTLCWTDYPGTPGADTDLVNDLDLMVYDGFHYYYCDGTTMKCDSVNNCEKYVSDSFNSGDDLEIRIKADNIMQGPQPFAFVVSGMDVGPIPEPGLCALVLGALALLLRRK